MHLTWHLLQAIYFTALFPYLVLTIFLIRGLMLSGVTHRLCYLFTPNISGGGQGAQWAREAGLGVSAGLGQGLWSGVCGPVHLQEVQVLTR